MEPERVLARPRPLVVRHETFVVAKPQRVWDALILDVDRWYTAGSEIDLRPGGNFIWRWKSWGPNEITFEQSGVVLEVQRSKRLAWRWAVPGGYETTVEVTVVPRKRGTVVVVEEFGWPDTQNGKPYATAAAAGWGESLTLLKFWVERGLRYEGVDPPPGHVEVIARKLRPFLRPKWLVAHVVAIAVAAVFVSLGMWQLDRLEDRRAFNATLLARARLPATPIENLLPTSSVRFEPSNPTVASAQYRRAVVVGTWDTEHEVILRSRSRNSIAGNHILTPLVTEEGDAMIVDRGWVPFALDEPPVRDAMPPAGRVFATGSLLPPQVRGRWGPTDPPTGVLEGVWRVDIARLQRQMPYKLYPLWLQMERQDPAQAGELPKSVEPPGPDEGPHFAYALQWFAFALAALLTYAAYVRQRAKRLARFAGSV